MKTKLLYAAAALALAGCAQKQAVIVHTGTLIGVDVSQSPQSQMYHAKLGFARDEYAFVPSNRTTQTNDVVMFGAGAKDVPDVLLEIDVRNILSGGGIYQRLAVGPNAVTQPGAAVMFSKDSSGNISTNFASVLAAQVAKTDIVTIGTATAINVQATAYYASPVKSAWNDVAVKLGWASFPDYLATGKSLGDSAVAKMTTALLAAKLISN